MRLSNDTLTVDCKNTNLLVCWQRSFAHMTETLINDKQEGFIWRGDIRAIRNCQDSFANRHNSSSNNLDHDRMLAANGFKNDRENFGPLSHTK